MQLGSGGPSQLLLGAFWALERLSKPKRLPHPILIFLLFISLKKCTCSHFYIRCGTSQQWMCGYEPPKSTKNTPWPACLLSLSTVQINHEFTRATCKQQSTPAHFQCLPSKEKTWNQQQMQETERRWGEKPNMANQELALWWATCGQESSLPLR